MASKGLGRGLEALLPSALPAPRRPGEPEGVTALPLDALVPNEGQPRKSMDEESLEELAASIRRQGVIQPLLVRKAGTPGKWQIVAGERRWRAARMAGLRELPVYVRELGDEEVMIAALAENLQREDLNPAEEALALRELKERLSLTQEELASRLGMSRPRVANALRLLQLPEEGLEALRRGEIAAGQARCLLAFSELPKQMSAFLAYMLERRLSVRDCEDVVAAWKRERVLPWIEGESARPRARRAKSPEQKSLERELGKRLSCRARVSGDESAGRISLIYGNAEQRRALLQALGVEG